MTSTKAPSPSAAHAEPKGSTADKPETNKRVKRRGGRRRRMLFLGLAFALFITVVKIGGCADRMFFYPFRGTYPTHPRAQEVWFENEGRNLHAWWFPAMGGSIGDDPAPTIVFCHGNAFNIKRHTAFMDFLPGEGFNVLVFDYRSYGMSDKGPMHRDGLIHDAGAAIDYVFSRDDIDPERVGVYGMSLGGTIGIAAAAEDDRIAAVCSLATFSTWEGVSGDFAPFIGPWLISPGRDAVDTVTELGERPLLIIHGTDDSIVDYRHAALIVEAAEAADVDVELQSFDGAGHINWMEKYPEMRDAIGVFFRETIGGGGITNP